ncbi:MAG: PEP-CTERM sorting domain-containing protein [Oceanicoccus sp.]
MKHFKKPTTVVTAILMAAVIGFCTAGNTAPIIVSNSDGLASGINDIEIAGFGTYDVTFSGHWVTYNNGETVDGGKLYTYDFAYAATSSLFDLLDGGSLQGSDLDLNPQDAVGCTSGGGCTMHTPWRYEQLGNYSANLYSQFVDNIYQLGGDNDTWTDGFDYSASGSAGPGYSNYAEDYSPITWSLDSSLYLTWTEASNPPPTASVPEPSTLILLSLGLMCLRVSRKQS